MRYELKMTALNIEELEELKSVMRHRDFVAALYAFSDGLREKYKYSQDEKEVEWADKAREYFFQVLGEYNLSLDDLG